MRLPQVSRKTLLIAVLAVATVTRLLVAFASGLPWWAQDTHGYFEMADGILTGRPLSYFPNGYPLMICAVRLLLPHAWLEPALIVANVLLSTATVLLAMLIARTIRRDPAVEVGAGVLVALYPHQLNYVRYLYSEVPTAFLVALGIYLAIQRRWLGAGLVLYLAGLFRSTVWPAAILALLVVVWFHRSLRPVVLMISGVALGLLAYMPLETWGVVKTPSNLIPNLQLATGARADAVTYARADFDRGEQSAALRAYVRYALEHPSAFARQRLRSLWELWGAWPERGEGQDARGTVARLLLGTRTVLVFAGLLGLWIYRRSASAWLCAVPVIVVTFVHLLMHSNARYTFVVEPPLIALAWAGTLAWLAVRHGDAAGHGGSRTRADLRA